MAGALDLSKTEEKKASFPDLDPFEHERRFLLTRAQAASFFGAIGSRATVELYDKARPVSFTRTTYLDTDDLSYFGSCEGPVARRLRIREYAVAESLAVTPVLSGVCFLELKQNSGTARSKVRLSTSPAALQAIIAANADGGQEAIAGDQQQAALAAIKSEIAPGRVSPRLMTWYRRTCMSAEAGRVRITLDEGLTFCRPQRLGRAGDPVVPTDVVARGPDRILEIKYWGDEPEWLGPAVANLSAAANFSKFRMGMMALGQHGSPSEQVPPARTKTPPPSATLFLFSHPNV